MCLKNRTLMLVVIEVSHSFVILAICYMHRKFTPAPSAFLLSQMLQINDQDNGNKGE